VARVLLNVPRSAARGQVIEIRALIQHEMETGYRPGANGEVLPRDIIRHFVCRYGDEVIFQAALYPAIAANPFLSFTTVATETGTLTFHWSGDNGFAQTETRSITVT